MSDNLKEIQAAFEEWAGYSTEFNPSAWKAWQAAIASQQAAHDAEIARLKEEIEKERSICTEYIEQRNDALAACAMKDEALKFMLLTAIYVIGQDEELPQRVKDFLAANVDSLPDDKTGEQILDDAIACLSASPQQVSEWERKQLEPLRAQVAVLRDVAEMLYSSFVDYVEGGSSDEVMEMTKHAIADTQATAEQFIAECDQRVAVKALKDAARNCRLLTNNACGSGFASQFDCANMIDVMAEGYSATSKKAG